MKIENFTYYRVTENVLFGLKDYMETLLYPTYKPLKGVARTGDENEIEVRIHWIGKPQILPFIVLSNKGEGFKENKQNFDSNSIIDEYVHTVDGVDIAFREKSIMGDITIECTMATEDSDARVKLADFISMKLMGTRETFIYRDGDGFSDSQISFTNKGYNVSGFNEVKIGNGSLEYLYVCKIDIPLFVEYHWIEQLFPGVVGGIVSSTGIIA